MSNHDQPRYYDLPKELRVSAQGLPKGMFPMTVKLLGEAADEIERLHSLVQPTKAK